MYTFFPPFVLLQYKYLDIVLNATQQDLIVNPFQVVSNNPKLPIPPIASLSPWGSHKSILQVHDFLLCGKVHLCCILDSSHKWYHMVFVFLFLTYFTQYESLFSLAFNSELSSPLANENPANLLEVSISKYPGV